MGTVDLILFASAAALAIAGIALIAWAIFASPPKGRRRCSKCWFDLVGLDTLRCPECGKLHKAERKLRKWRRRWRWVVIALIPLALASVGPMHIRARDSVNGWWANLPTTVLILYVDEDTPPESLDELQRRIHGRSSRNPSPITTNQRNLFPPPTLFGSCVLPMWQQHLIADRCASQIEQGALGSLAGTTIPFDRFALFTFGYRLDPSAIESHVHRFMLSDDPEICGMALGIAVERIHCNNTWVPAILHARTLFTRAEIDNNDWDPIISQLLWSIPDAPRQLLHDDLMQRVCVRPRDPMYAIANILSFERLADPVLAAELFTETYSSCHSESDTEVATAKLIAEISGARFDYWSISNWWDTQLENPRRAPAETPPFSPLLIFTIEWIDHESPLVREYARRHMHAYINHDIRRAVKALIHNSETPTPREYLMQARAMDAVLASLEEAVYARQGAIKRYPNDQILERLDGLVDQITFEAVVSFEPEAHRSTKRLHDTVDAVVKRANRIRALVGLDPIIDE